MACNILEQATGAFQIRPIRLLDYNQRTGTVIKLRIATIMISQKRYFCIMQCRLVFQNMKQLREAGMDPGKPHSDIGKKSNHIFDQIHAFGDFCDQADFIILLFHMASSFFIIKCFRCE